MTKIYRVYYYHADKLRPNQTFMVLSGLDRLAGSSWCTSLYLVQECILPQTEDHHEAAISRPKRCEEVLSRERKKGASFKSNITFSQSQEIKLLINYWGFLWGASHLSPHSTTLPATTTTITTLIPTKVNMNNKNNWEY